MGSQSGKKKQYRNETSGLNRLTTTTYPVATKCGPAQVENWFPNPELPTNFVDYICGLEFSIMVYAY